MKSIEVKLLIVTGGLTDFFFFHALYLKVSCFGVVVFFVFFLSLFFVFKPFFEFVLSLAVSLLTVLSTTGKYLLKRVSGKPKN